MGFASGGGDVQTWSFVLLCQVKCWLRFCASKPVRTQSPKTLPAFLEKLLTKNNK
jgi:hypothetical protein